MENRGLLELKHGILRTLGTFSLEESTRQDTMLRLGGFADTLWSGIPVELGTMPSLRTSKTCFKIPFERRLIIRQSCRTLRCFRTRWSWTLELVPVRAKSHGLDEATTRPWLKFCYFNYKGILSYFAVQSGARKVWAVEASNMAEKMKRFLAAAGPKVRLRL